MTPQKLNEKYIDYVQCTLHAGNVPLAFPEWNAARIAEENRSKPFHIRLTSHVLHGDVTFHVSAKNESEAYKEACRLLQNVEQRYGLETDHNGKVLTPQEQVDVLMKRLEARENSMKRQLLAAAARVKALEEKVAKMATK